MKLKFSSWADYHHQIYRIYHGIIALSLVPFFLVFLELEVTQLKEPIVAQWLSRLIPILLIPVIGYLNWQVWKSGDFAYPTEEGKTIREKLVLFRKTEIKKYVRLEVLSVLALGGLWLTANYFFVIIYFALLAQFSFLRPSEDRFARNMRLTKEERNALRESNF